MGIVSPAFLSGQTTCTAAKSNDSAVVLEQGFRVVHVSFVPRADNRLLKKICGQFAGFSVVMALEIETPFNLSFTTAIIDLMRSRHHGAPFPDEIYRAPETWARRAYPNLVYFHEVEKGGHFAAWEQPELFAEEIRTAFRSVR